MTGLKKKKNKKKKKQKQKQKKKKKKKKKRKRKKTILNSYWLLCILYRLWKSDYGQVRVLKHKFEHKYPPNERKQTVTSRIPGTFAFFPCM